MIKNANNGYWDNRNPRGVDAAAMYKNSVPAAVFAKFEKAEGAHKNGMENLPLFIGAVILGNMAKLESSRISNSRDSGPSKTPMHRHSQYRRSKLSCPSRGLHGTVYQHH
jgi:hypothetical protein